MPAYKSKARFWKKTHKSGNFTWVVKLGKKIDGKPSHRNFPTEIEAKAFMEKWNESLQLGDATGLKDLSELAKLEVRTAIEKIKPFGRSIDEAVDFYINHGLPTKPTVTTEEAWKLFVEVKARSGRRPTYYEKACKTYFQPFARQFPGRMTNSITPSEAKSYIYAKSNWSNSTRASHIHYLRTLYNFLENQGHVHLNPFAKLDIPKAPKTISKTISPPDVKALLEFALKENRKPECACMILVFFCGVRVAEVGRLCWEQIDLKNMLVKIEWEDAKTSDRRVNVISANAFEWLQICKSKGRISPNDFNQRLKRLRAKSGIKYPQNGMRHSFAAYHLAKHKDSAKTAHQLGHPNAALLHKNYYSSVEPHQADAYWSILPNAVMKAKEALAKEAAEEESNCSQAIKDENGTWVPVTAVTNEDEVFDPFQD